VSGCGYAERVPHFEVQLTKKLQRVYEVAQDTVIGRAPQCEIQLLSRAVSRRHARIEFDGQQAIISDLGTKNGIKLNGQRVQGAAVVSEGDEVVVGDIHMRYRAANRAIVADDAVDLRNRAATQQDLVHAIQQPRATFLLRAHPEVLNHFQSTVGRGRIDHQGDFDPETKFKLQLALREALDNARVHGCGGDPNRTIHVTFGEDEDEFVISVQDEGPGYSVEEALAGLQEIDPLSAVRDRASLGKPLGMRIILSCVDRVQFEGRGTTIHMGRFKEAGQFFVISEDAVVGSDADPFAETEESVSPLHLQQQQQQQQLGAPSLGPPGMAPPGMAPPGMAPPGMGPPGGMPPMHGPPPGYPGGPPPGYHPQHGPPPGYPGGPPPGYPPQHGPPPGYPPQHGPPPGYPGGPPPGYPPQHGPPPGYPPQHGPPPGYPGGPPPHHGGPPPGGDLFPPGPFPPMPPTPGYHPPPGLAPDADMSPIPLPGDPNAPLSLQPEDEEDEGLPGPISLDDLL